MAAGRSSTRDGIACTPRAAAPDRIARIDDRLTASVDVFRLDRIDVSLTGTVAALAVDSFGSAPVNTGPLPSSVTSARVSVVTRHAVLIDQPAEVLMHGFVIAGAHSPIAGSRARLRSLLSPVPAHRHLEQSSVSIAVQKCLCVVARADHVMGFDLEGVRLCAIEADLVTPLIKPAVALQHRVMPVRCFVVQPAVPASSCRCPGARMSAPYPSGRMLAIFAWQFAHAEASA